MEWTDGFGNTPYDPDMTVGEALDLGLIAVMDTGVIGRTYHEPCGYGSGLRGHDYFRCTRVAGHSGNHAVVFRWIESVEDLDQKAREEKQRQQKAELADRERRAAEADLNRMRAQIERAAKTIPVSMEKTMKSMQEALAKQEAREWSAVQRNFRDHTAGKVRGPKR